MTRSLETSERIRFQMKIRPHTVDTPNLEVHIENIFTILLYWYELIMHFRENLYESKYYKSTIIHVYVEYVYRISEITTFLTYEHNPQVHDIGEGGASHE